MCQIFAYSSSKRTKLNSILKEFYSHSEEHPNGWGLATFDGVHANIEREPLRAAKSNYLKERFTEDIAAPVVLAHIRKATIGNVELKNCHPFTGFDTEGRRWTLIHNGTVFEFEPMNKYVKRQKGETDSERILLYIIDKINEESKNKNRSLSESERFKVIENIVTKLSKGNKLNLIIYDGDLLYVHTNLEGSLNYYQGNKFVLFATEPLVKGSIYDGENDNGWSGMKESDWEKCPEEKILSHEDWNEVPVATLLGYKGKDLIYKGSEHGNLYVEDPKDLEHIYLSYANL
ncbi:MAG: class II glutamine amidotransferase [Lachnospiraceae bacterium]|nr:class II glutamine amidotransferase [Lachnospiraceae bacterium]